MLRRLADSARARAELDAEPMPTFRVTTDAEAAAAIGRIVEHFGRDPSRAAVRIVFDDDSQRYLERADMDAWVLPLTKGLGQSAYAGLPGRRVPGTALEFEFRCPVNGCPESPLFVFSFTDPPVCRRHGVTMILTA